MFYLLGLKIGPLWNTTRTRPHVSENWVLQTSFVHGSYYGLLYTFHHLFDILIIAPTCFGPPTLTCPGERTVVYNCSVRSNYVNRDGKLYASIMGECTPLGQAFWANDTLYMAIVAACTVFRGADGYRLATEQLTQQIRVSGSERINLTSTLFHHPTRRHRACAMTSYLYRYSPICAVICADRRHQSNKTSGSDKRLRRIWKCIVRHLEQTRLEPV